jgi:hypothetical protein
LWWRLFPHPIAEKAQRQRGNNEGSDVHLHLPQRPQSPKEAGKKGTGLIHLLFCLYFLWFFISAGGWWLEKAGTCGPPPPRGAVEKK